MIEAPAHGTMISYRRGCRCAECRQANTDYCRIGEQQRGRLSLAEEKERRRQRSAQTHGTESSYNQGCRCRTCKDAAASARRGRRARQAAASRDEALEWLLHWPAYRELIRQRISDEQKRRREIDVRREAHDQRRDVDRLGREVEGCG